jgi:hypothetical protein
MTGTATMLLGKVVGIIVTWTVLTPFDCIMHFKNVDPHTTYATSVYDIYGSEIRLSQAIKPGRMVNAVILNPGSWAVL